MHEMVISAEFRNIIQIIKKQTVDGGKTANARSGGFSLIYIYD